MAVPMEAAVLPVRAVPTEEVDLAVVAVDPGLIADPQPVAVPIGVVMSEIAVLIGMGARRAMHASPVPTGSTRVTALIAAAIGLSDLVVSTAMNAAAVVPIKGAVVVLTVLTATTALAVRAALRAKVALKARAVSTVRIVSKAKAVLIETTASTAKIALKAEIVQRGAATGLIVQDPASPRDPSARVPGGMTPVVVLGGEAGAGRTPVRLLSKTSARERNLPIPLMLRPMTCSGGGTPPRQLSRLAVRSIAFGAPQRCAALRNFSSY